MNRSGFLVKHQFSIVLAGLLSAAIWLAFSGSGSTASARFEPSKASVNAPVAMFNTITVTTTANTIAADGQCSLREAIINANNDAATHADCAAGSGADTIALQAGATYTLNTRDNTEYGGNGLPAITSTIIIEGKGATITGSGLPFRLIYIASSGNLMLQNVILKNGVARGGDGGGMNSGGGGGGGLGGGIYNKGSLTVLNSTLQSNTASGGGGGGGFNGQGGGGGGGLGGNGGSGSAPNTPAGGGGGGGFTGNGGPGGSGSVGGGGGGTTADGSVPTGGATNGGDGGTIGSIDGNSGGLGGGGGGGGALSAGSPGSGGSGGIGGGGGGGGGGCNGGSGGGGGGFGGGGGGGGSCGGSHSGGPGGFGGGGGGGGYANSGGGSSLFGGGNGGSSASVSSGGPAGGGGGGGAGLGGAIFNEGGTLTLTNTTFSFNTASGGNGGNGLVINAGLGIGSRGGNGGSALGGALFNLNGSVTLTHCTFNSNTVSRGNGGGSGSFSGSPGSQSGGGIYNLRQGGTATLMLTNNILANSNNGVDAVNNAGTINGSNNLIESNTGVPASVIITTADPLLGPLTLNTPGNTPTHALLSGSPALDQGAVTGLITDQRGATRPVDLATPNASGGNGSDLGAYEFAYPCSTINLSASLPNGAANVSYSQTLTASGGTAPYTFTVMNGSLPGGLTLSPGGLLSGTPSAGCNFNFTITATDANNCTGSQSYALTISDPPTISSQPSNQTVCASQPATFSVTASGAGLSYQWRKSGTSIAGATSSSFTLASAGAGDAGSYDVVVSGTCGAPVTSTAASLSVITPPVITSQPGNQAVCAGAPASFAVIANGTAPFTYQWRRNGVNISGANSASYNIAAVAAGDDGAYTVEITSSVCLSISGNSVISNPAGLTVNPIPAAPVTTGASRCGPGSVTLTASGGGGTLQWYADAALTNQVAAGPSFVTPSLSTTTTYYVTETSTAGCVSATSTVIATINPIPTAPITTDASRCGTGSVTLTASGSGGTLKWYADLALNVQVASGPSFSTPSLSTTTTYYVTETSVAGCISAASPVTATINPLPATPATTSASRCGPGTVILTASGSGGLLKWYSDTGLTNLVNTGASFSPNLSATATYYVTETSAAGCVSAAGLVTATINPIPVAPATTSASRCGPGAVTLSASGSGTLKWYVDPALTNQIATGPSFTTPSLSVTTTYYVTDTSATGCESAASSVTATINPLPAPVITGTAAVCAGQPVTLDAGAGFSSYAWSTGAPTQTITVTPGTTTTYSVMVTNASGCSANTSKTVTVNPSPVVSVNHTEICAGSSATLTATVSSGTAPFSFNWTGPGGFTATTQSISVSAAGAYNVSVTDAADCVAASASGTLTVNPKPSVTVNNAAVCAGAAATLSATVTGGTAPFSFIWSGPSGFTASTQSINASVAGTYSVLVTDAKGCVAAAASGTLTVNAATSINSQPTNQTVNAGAPVSFSVTAAGTGPLTYQWRRNGTPIGGATANTFNLASAATGDAGNYDVTVTGACGSLTSTPASLTVNTPTGTNTQLLANRDSFLRQGADDTNEGANQRLRTQSSGHNRVVIGFDMSGVSTAGLVSATLVLNIAENVNNWGDGRLMDAHRLLTDWTEGNGSNDGIGPAVRGTGEGVTWRCAKDANINNQSGDCSAPWNGGTFAPATAPGALHTNGLTGQVSWDVTLDVLQPNGAPFGWVIKKREEGPNGQVRYYSREGASAAGNPNFAPKLVLVYNQNNNAPTAVNDTAVTPKNTTVDIAVLTNDSDTDGGTLRVISVTQGSLGSVTINADSTVRYAPHHNVYGNDAFTYTIFDSRGGQATGTVAVTVNSAGPLVVVKDSFITQGSDNTNEGANERLRIQSSGNNRAVLAFDLSGVSTAGLVSARLVLNVAENSDNWGTTGRLVDAHRLLVDWAEGNGRNDVMAGDGPSVRGTGAGVTWRCAADANINNSSADCGSPWNGGSFAGATAPGALHANGLVGEVSWDVTADVLAGAQFGWLIKKREEGQNGQVQYHSREGAIGNPTLAPRLILVYAP